MASGMVKTLLVSGLIAAQATGVIAAPVASGIDSNRAALGLPVDSRLSSCVAPAGAAAAPAGVAGAPCGAASDASDLAGHASLALLIALGGLALVGIGFAASSGGHHHGSGPVSP